MNTVLEAKDLMLKALEILDDAGLAVPAAYLQQAVDCLLEHIPEE